MISTSKINLKGDIHGKMVSPISDRQNQALLYGTVYSILVKPQEIVCCVHQVYEVYINTLDITRSCNGSQKTRRSHYRFGKGFVINDLTGLVIPYT